MSVRNGEGMDADRLQSEFRLLCACLRWPRPPAEAFSTISARGIDWARFDNMVAWHRVGGIVHRAIADYRLAVPSHVGSAIEQRARSITIASMHRVRDASCIAALFNAAAIPHFFFKGEALAVQIYGSIGVRHSIDLDVFVPAPSLKAALDALRKAGFVRLMPRDGVSDWRTALWVRTQKDIMLRSPSGITVEVHWRLLENRHLLAGAAQTNPVMVEVGAGTRLSTLPPDSQFLYLCAHGSYSGWFRLKWLADIGALLAQMNGGDVWKLRDSARAAGITRCVDQALLLSARLLGSELPAGLADALEADWQVRMLADLATRIMIVGGETDDPASRMKRELLTAPSRWLMGDSPRYALSEAWRLLTNPRDLLSSDAPDWLLQFAVLARLPYWIWKRRPGAARGLPHVETRG